MKNYDLVSKDNGWYTISDKVECVLDVKEEWKIDKLGNYNLESIEKYYKYLRKSDRENGKKRLLLLEDYIKSQN